MLCERNTLFTDLKLMLKKNLFCDTNYNYFLHLKFYLIETNNGRRHPVTDQ